VSMNFKRFSLSISQADKVEKKEGKRKFNLLRLNSIVVEVYVSSSVEVPIPIRKGLFLEVSLLSAFLSMEASESSYETKP